MEPVVWHSPTFGFCDRGALYVEGRGLLRRSRFIIRSQTCYTQNTGLTPQFCIHNESNTSALKKNLSVFSLNRLKFWDDFYHVQNISIDIKTVRKKLTNTQKTDRKFNLTQLNSLIREDGIISKNCSNKRWIKTKTANIIWT